MDVLSEVQVMEKKKGISGSTLKIIALAAMLIDHFAAIILDNYLLSNGLADLDQTNVNAVMEFLSKFSGIYYTDVIMRLVGRIGFPIFAFLLVEGFLHTRNKKKYALNLGIFALVSEIPFNLAFIKNPWDITYQNVFFTLFIGLLVLAGFYYIEGKWKENKILSVVLRIVILIIGMLCANFLKTDYAGMGVATIAVMYLLRKRKMLQATAGCVILTMMTVSEVTAFFSLIPIKLYNGERGINMKYLFYAFYPAHILILYIIAVCMKIV